MNCKIESGMENNHKWFGKREEMQKRFEMKAV